MPVAAALAQIAALGEALDQQHGLSPGQRRGFCALGDLIDQEQAAAKDAGQQALAAQWQQVYEQWIKLYAALTGDASAITQALGERVRDCCQHQGAGVAGAGVL